jgi:hypothetical protein
VAESARAMIPFSDDLTASMKGLASTTAGRLAPAASRLARPMLHRLRNPFPDQFHPTLVHVAHHKVATVWFQLVLSRIAKEFGLSFGVVTTARHPEREALLYRHARLFEAERLSTFRGSHLVRDPRDVVVSAYFYHLWTTEEWVHVPRPELGGRTYQEHLRALGPEEGFAAEIHRSAESNLADMAAWDYTQPEFIELRYEDLILDEGMHFERMFRHYGFRDDAVERSVGLAARFSFRRVAGRSLGDVREGDHMRSGKPGQWQEVFTPAHRTLFRELTGNLVERLGYSPGDD